jgi:hypothetical protein
MVSISKGFETIYEYLVAPAAVGDAPVGFVEEDGDVGVLIAKIISTVVAPIGKRYDSLCVLTAKGAANAKHSNNLCASTVILRQDNRINRITV